MTDLEVLARGWMARIDLDRHTETVAGFPIQERVAPGCPGCGAATAAWLRGVSVQRFETMFCELVQQLRAEIKAADEVAKRVSAQ